MTNFYRKIIIICGVMFFAFHPPAIAQQKDDKVTINVKNGSLEEIILLLKKQTDLKIVYNQELLRRNSVRMPFYAKDEPLKAVMRRLLKSSSLTFVVNDGVLIIAPKEDEQDVRLDAIKGLVQDEKGFPLVGVTVNVTGRPNNTLTDENGRFSIALDNITNLTFSYVGFKKKTLPAITGEVMRINLIPELVEMQEVVVTGYQEVNRRISASSTVTLSGDQVNEPGSTNIVSMLQGKVAGLSVVKTSGSPNAIPTMRMRGTSTLVGNANPIIVVDGVIRENPNELNPENLLGIEPSARDLILMKDGINATGSLTGNSISGLNVNDVESITFLKDASATAIYGTRAANGVIVITTKKGKEGNLQVAYSSNYGLSLRPKYSQLQLMNSQQRVQFSREMYEDGYLYRSMPIKMGYEGAFQDLVNKKITESEFQQEVSRLSEMNTDWFDILFRNSFNNSQHLSFSGGTDKVSYYTSLSYNGAKGTAKLDNYSEGAASMRLNADLGRKLKLGMLLNGSYRTSTGYFGQNPLDYALKTSRAISASLTYPTTQEVLPGILGSPIGFNMINELQQTGNQTKDTKVNATIDLNYLITRGLRFVSMAGGAVNTQASEQYATELTTYVSNYRGYDFGTVAPGSEAELTSLLPHGGILLPSNSTMYNYTLRNMLDFNRTIFGENHLLNVVAGQELRSVHNQSFSNLIPGYFRNRGEVFAVTANSIPLLNPKKVNSVANALSGFGMATYSYAGKYILNGNIRVDASNRFGQYANQRFLPVWSLAGRWNIGSEEWLKENKIVNDLYVKTSYGFQGNVITSVGPELVVTVNDGSSAFSAAANEYFLKIKSYPYPDLRWEKTRSVNVELGGVLLHSMVNFNLAYYRKMTTDAIVSRTIPSEYGVQRMLINGGNIKNEGYEAQLGLNLINKKDIGWSVNMNGAKNFNKLLQGTVRNIQITVYDYFNGTAFIEGASIGTIYGFVFKGLNPKNGMPVFEGVDDANRLASTSLLNFLKPLGTRDAKISGGLNTNLRYKAFSLGANFSYKLGSVRFKNGAYNSSSVNIPMPEQNLPAVLAQRWRKPGDEAFTNIPSFPRNTEDGMEGYAFSSTSGSLSRYVMYTNSDVNLVSGSFLRCNNIDFAYRLADRLSKKLHVKQVSLSASASNLFVIADKRLNGQDPEIDGAGSTALPISKMLGLGLNVTF
ncbi:SusC/RagA family TonB-linked outer membrane protein [Pedobacter rhizosphaerae]|uniref:TonB-linked outer membrane protein, SusC/RagA family n=1 Tax=Pedobacter rhizosphaerae TaxID=390241 RepID=A0A1H9KR19_9SPHI|nr:SusC/RagA family TonB-linked outer membrane protein [Pedobacter rhizosphaerae]SER01604.1 TonB-linked outer membrane protein, SusC/RagA family [Pedobacter rhizosphaerae]